MHLVGNEGMLFEDAEQRTRIVLIQFSARSPDKEDVRRARSLPEMHFSNVRQIDVPRSKLDPVVHYIRTLSTRVIGPICGSSMCSCR
jgi:hypothetical protein